ncbi:hypothetical protein EJF36_18305 [Bacillus sp. HMF5848]|uniref:MG2 domain-containing protein n=1 Tax=Bacillus sp. HMF5848 TaxID=2495421 RepID=UPI000F76FA22|nr:MG2 domain-containing protein [Bacillus sp. HMF5848]RSK28661.1 hypothetical protein EJF36_18305 [Bacillus sp. HMF5848]
MKKRIFICLTMISLIFSSVIPAFAASTSLTVSTDADTYLPGEKVTISGSVFQDGQPAPELNPRLSVKAPNSSSVFNWQWSEEEVEEDGSISTFFTLNDDAALGEYTVTIVAAETTETTTFTVVEAKEVNVVTVSTDKQSYVQGEKVTINGTVLRDGQPAPQLNPTVTVKAPNGSSIFNWQWSEAEAKEDGSFSTSFTLNEDAVVGNYKVTLVAGEESENVTFNVSEGTTPEEGFILTDKNTYEQGDKVTISGKVLQDGEPAPQLNPRLSVIDPRGTSIFNWQWSEDEVEADGTISIFFTLNDDAKLGTYTVKLVTGEETKESTFTVTEQTLDKQVTVSTDSDKYDQGDTVTITGEVSQGGSAVTSANVKVTVEKNGEPLKVVTVQTDDDGNYEYEYELASDATVGSYTVKVTALDHEVTTTFMVSLKSSGGSNPPGNPVPGPSPVTPDKGNNGKQDVALSNVLTQINNEKAKNVLIKLLDGNVAANVQKDVLQKLVEKQKGLTIEGEKATLTFTAKTLQKLLEKANGSLVFAAHKVEHDMKGHKATSDVFDFTVTNTLTNKLITEFEQPVVVEIKVDTTKVKDARKTAVYYWNEEEQEWQYVGGTMTENGTMMFKTHHFSVYAAIEQDKTFADITGWDWAKDQIEVLASRDIIQGKSVDVFAPGANVTRAQFAILLSRALNLPQKAYAGVFSDVPATMDWAAPEIEAAYHAGIVTGKDDGTFDPYSPITRQQMAAMIARAINYQYPTLAETEMKQLSFEDATQIHGYAVESVQLAFSLGIIQGKQEGKIFAPAEFATRAQTAVMLYRLLDIAEEF